ncbi:DUF1275 domain-containing protein [Treponema sp. OMZ 840]|uniref:YoaK family protein n=1 Tax=Treponema sp. OMZ 840 TaxID=244313 RepID=UPI003D8C527C
MKTSNVFILIWTAALTFVSGLLNGTGFLLYASALSHHTGNLTRAAVELSQLNVRSALYILTLPASFFTGAFISGLLFHEKNFEFSKRYGILLMSFSLIFMYLGVFNTADIPSTVFMCLILGIQNGMFIFYKGILIRTTHFTGYLTDAALCLGSAFCGTAGSEKKKNDLKKSLFYLLSILCFTAGGMFSVFIKAPGVFFAAALIYFICGLCYFTLRKLKHRH